ncbi:MAG TPA: OmpH family outer membrane protein [Pirellulaceae bacterium]|nr:OmpH family outer membrane protein [Pirellulaceae bacterium]
MTYVGIIDLSVVFDNHPHFTSQLQALKQEAEGYQASVLRQSQQLTRDMESVSLIYKPGTTEFAEKEKDLRVQLAKLEVDARSKMRELMVRESQLHFNVLREVNQLVAEYCREKEIRMVLRYSRPVKVSPTDPDSVMQWVNGTVVYFRPERDITDVIVQRLQGRTAQLPGGTTIRQ